MKYSIEILERPFGKIWQIQQERFFESEIQARNEFDKIVASCFNSADPIKIRIHKGKMKIAEFSLSYPV